MRLRPIHRQVIVITGASSGIGLSTARLAAGRGAAVVLAARNGPALERIAAEIEAGGGRAAVAVADVGREEEVERIAGVALERFGRIDTWFNCAAAFIFGRLLEVPTEEHRRLFDTNYWGVVYGSRTAVRHLRANGGGGALINMGSGLGDRAIPIQGAYSASKFAVHGFTEALRMEIEQEGLPISVTLVKPSSIDTPYYRTHAKNYLARGGKNPPPVYDPRVAARAVLHCAAHPKRDVYIGGGAKLLSVVGGAFPRLTDLVMERVMTPLQTRDEPAGPREHHALFQPTEDGDERGDHPNHVSRTSLYTAASLHPVVTGLAVAGAVALSAAWLRARANGIATRAVRS